MTSRPIWPLALLYIALRVLLTVVVAAAIFGIGLLAGLDMPVLVAAMLAVILQLPLAWLILGGMRREVTGRLAASAGDRKVLRDELRAALAGDRDDPQDADHTADRGGDGDLDHAAERDVVRSHDELDRP